MSFRLPGVAVLLLAVSGCDEDPGSVVDAGGAVVIDNPAPPEDFLRLSREPLLAVGGRQAAESETLHDVTGAKRLADGGVVLAVTGNYELRRYDSGGRMLWRAGREGEGPGEFSFVFRLLGGCTTVDDVVAYDRSLRRVTVLDGQGALVATHALGIGDLGAYAISCAPNGRVAMSAWGERRAAELGPTRWEVDLGYGDIGSDAVHMLREDVPGQDRVQYEGTNGPRVWGRRAVFGATDRGIWLGTGDEYELEFVDWAGRTEKRVRWAGPDLEVREDHIVRYRASRRAAALRRSDDANVGPEFERRWRRTRASLPERFPSLDGIHVLPDGSFWVERYEPPGVPDEMWYFDVDGRWTRTLRVPPRVAVLDAGATWVVMRGMDEYDVQSVRVHALEPDG